MKEKVASAAAGAVIVVDGIIGRPSGSGSVNTAGEMAEAIDRAVCGGEREATVDIRSTGGDVHEALGMYDILAGSGLRITTRCFGYVASAATIVAQAASPGRRLIAPGALYLIHRAESAAEGNAGDMTAAVELLTKTDAGIAGIYAARSGRDAREFAALMSENGGRGRWLTASEAVAAGLADSVLPVRVRGEADPAVWLRRAAGELCSMLGIAPLPLVAAGGGCAEGPAGGSADSSGGGAPVDAGLGGVPDCPASGGGADGNRTANRLRDTAAGDVLESVRRLLRRLARRPAGSGARTENAGPAADGVHGAGACGGAYAAAADCMTVSPESGVCGGSHRDAGGGSAAGNNGPDVERGGAAGLNAVSGAEGAERSGAPGADPGNTVRCDVLGAASDDTGRSRGQVAAPGGSCLEGGTVGSVGASAAGGDLDCFRREIGFGGGSECPCREISAVGDGGSDCSRSGAGSGSGSEGFCREGGTVGGPADSGSGGASAAGGGDDGSGDREAGRHGCGAAGSGHSGGTDSAGRGGGCVSLPDDCGAVQPSVVARADGEPNAGAGRECRVSDSAAPRWLPVEDMLKRQAAARRTRTVEVEDPSPQGDEPAAGNDEAYRLDALGISGR